MKCTILGAGPGMPLPDWHMSSLVLETNDGNFLLNCGDGTARQALKQGYNNDFLDAVLISHYHPDHISGIYMLMQMLYLEGRTKPLRLFLPERLDDFLDTLHMFYTFEQRFPFVLKINDMKEVNSYYPNITSYLTDHLVGYKEFITSHNYCNPMRSYCFSFKENGRVLVYTSDLETFQNIKAVLESADILIIDALHPSHELIQSLVALKADRIILTHGISESLRIWMDYNTDKRFEIARENVSYYLSGV